MYKKVIDILSNFVEVDVDAIKEDSTLRNDLGLSSLDVVNIVVAFEDEFDIEIPDRDIVNLVTVGDISNYINERLK